MLKAISMINNSEINFSVIWWFNPVMKILLLLIVSMLTISNAYAEDKSLEERETLGNCCNIYEDLKEEINDTLPQIVNEIPLTDNLVMAATKGNIGMASEAAYGCIMMYALQTAQESTSPEARGLIIYYYEGRIQTLMYIQDTLELIKQSLQDERLKVIVQKAADNTKIARQSAQVIAGDLRKDRFVVPPN